MMRYLVLLICTFSFPLLAQEGGSIVVTDSMPHYSSKVVPVFDKDYLRKYRNTRRLVLEVYAYALYAADLLATLENDGVAIEKRRKQNKFYRESYKSLKEDFKYVILDMYTDEGRMLMKLVHRESGMTVYDAAEKYKGKASAEIFALMGKLFDQDIRAEYDSLKTDKVTEHVIRDIQAGIIPFENKVVILTKQDYHEMEVKRNERAELAHKRNKELIKKRKLREKEKKKKMKERDKELRRNRSESSREEADK